MPKTLEKSAKDFAGRRPRRRAADRTGALLTTELIFVLPVIFGLSLIVLQFLLIHSAYTRVQDAALEGARLAADGATMNQIEDGVGIALGYLAVGPGHSHISVVDEVVGFEVSRQYVDADGDFDNNCIAGNPNPAARIEATEDYVIVGVRIPMNRVAPNYLALFCGGTVDGLQLRSVVKHKMHVDVVYPSVPCQAASPASVP